MEDRLKEMLSKDALELSENDKLDFICWHIQKKTGVNIRNQVNLKANVFFPHQLIQQYERNQQMKLNYAFETAKLQYV